MGPGQFLVHRFTPDMSMREYHSYTSAIRFLHVDDQSRKRRENNKNPGRVNEMIDDSHIHMHMRYSKWAEMAAFETLEEEAKKEIIVRKLEQQILHKEFKIGHMQHKLDTLKLIKQAMTKKKK